jgi:hypothetical protein
VAAAVAVTVALGLATTASVRIFLAERQLETVLKPDLERSIRLASGNSEAWARLGALLEREGDGAGAVRALDQAVRLNSYNAPAWVDLALHWELEGDAARAERCLLQAVRVDGGVSTHWALVNFYLRQGVDDRFWNVMRATLQGSRTELESAFDLCWRASSDPAEILQKAIPDSPEILRRYFRYVLDSQRKPALEAVWNRLSPLLAPADRELGLRYVDLLIEEKRIAEAMAVWNRLSDPRLIAHHGTLDPARGLLITNGQFLYPLSGQAFDWRVISADGVAAEVEQNGKEGNLRIRLGGTHPESTELFWQWVPVMPEQDYRLTFSYRTEGLPQDTGLYWVVRDENAGAKAELLTTPGLAAQEPWGRSGAAFRTGRETRLVRLVFAYHRALGTTRSRGGVSLAGVQLLPGAEAPKP